MSSQSPIVLAIKTKDKELVELILNKAPAEHVNKHAYELFRQATISEDADVIALLMKQQLENNLSELERKSLKLNGLILPNRLPASIKN